MSRRNFLTSLSWVSAFIPKPFRRDRVAATQKTVSEIYLCEVSIAGLLYHDASEPEAIEAFVLGEELILQREPENGYDSAAIAIQTPEGHMLGYVPSQDNAILATLMDQGISLMAEVSSLNPELPNWGRMMVKIYQIS